MTLYARLVRDSSVPSSRREARRRNVVGSSIVELLGACTRPDLDCNFHALSARLPNEDDAPDLTWVLFVGISRWTSMD